MGIDFWNNRSSSPLGVNKVNKNNKKDSKSESLDKVLLKLADLKETLKTSKNEKLIEDALKEINTLYKSYLKKATNKNTAKVGLVKRIYETLGMMDEFNQSSFPSFLRPNSPVLELTPHFKKIITDIINCSRVDTHVVSSESGTDNEPPILPMRNTLERQKVSVTPVSKPPVLETSDDELDALYEQIPSYMTMTVDDAKVQEAHDVIILHEDISEFKEKISHLNGLEHRELERKLQETTRSEFIPRAVDALRAMNEATGKDVVPPPMDFSTYSKESIDVMIRQETDVINELIAVMGRFSEREEEANRVGDRKKAQKINYAYNQVIERKEKALERVAKLKEALRLKSTVGSSETPLNGPKESVPKKGKKKVRFSDDV